VRLFSRFISSFAFLTASGCLGLDYYTPVYDDTAVAFGVPEADADADADSDADADLAPIAIDSVTPDYGTNAGGTPVLIKGGPFDTSVQVTFGGVPGVVAPNVSTNEIRVMTPATADAGAVDIQITTNSGRGSQEGGFRFFLDGTGMAGTMGFVYWAHFLGDYWSNAADTGGAWWSILSAPEERTLPEIFYGPNLDACVSDHSDEGFFVDDLEVPITTLRVNNRAIVLNWDSSQYAWTKVFGVGDFVQSANYDLDTIAASAYPEFSVGNFARTPSTFLLASPNLNTLGYLRQQDLTFQWTQATADEMLLVLTRMQDVGGTTMPQETVTCRITNNGNGGTFTVPTSVWTGWGGDYLEVDIAALTYAAGSLPFNNANSGVVGAYWLIGAAFMQ
jgi:hypothetical protein